MSYRELSAFDIATMLTDKKLASSMDRFSSDHRSKIRTPFRQYAAMSARRPRLRPKLDAFVEGTRAGLD